MGAMTAKTAQTTDDTLMNEQTDLARSLGIEHSSATYIARTLDLVDESEFGDQVDVLATAYGLETADVQSISRLFGRRSPARAAA